MKRLKHSPPFPQRGASLVEAVVVIPLLLFIVLGVLQTAMVFYAKSNLNYAAHEAARAGSVNNASVASINLAFYKALVPYYGGGSTSAELATKLAQVTEDINTHAAVRVEILSPSQESFTDFNSPALQSQMKVTEEVIPNAALNELNCPRDQPGCPSDPKTNASGQSLADANLLKLRITYGIPQAKQMPLAGTFYTWALKQTGAGASDPYKLALIDAGRIPVITHTTLRMQSNAVRNAAMVSSPGPGNNGAPTDPGPVASEGGSGLPSCPWYDPNCAICSSGSTGDCGGGSGGGGGTCPAVK